MEAATVEEIVAGNLVIRPDEFLAHVDGRPMALTMRELSLLVALARRGGRVVSREELYAVVWQQPYRRYERSVDVYVGEAAPEARGGGAALALHPHPLRLRLPVRCAAAPLALLSLFTRTAPGARAWRCEVPSSYNADTAPALPARSRSAF